MKRRRRNPVSDDEDDEGGTASSMASHSATNGAGVDRWRRRDEPRQKRGTRRLRIDEEVDDSEEEAVEQDQAESRSSWGDEDDDEEEEEEAKPIGDVVRVTGKGTWKTNHFAAFEYKSNCFELEDIVLLSPEDEQQKPYVAIIKDITQSTKDGSMMIDGQWLYRPEEAERKGGRNWETHDSRELFYSFHRDAVPAESVMHKCVVHFIPPNKQLPKRKQFPGFIVQKVYDTELRKLFKLTDKDYEDSKQEEIDFLVKETVARLGELPDLDVGYKPHLDREKLGKGIKLQRKKNLSHSDVSEEDEGTGQSDQHLKTGAPVSASKYYTILVNFNALTKDAPRDKWLEKLLQSVEYVCSPSDIMQEEKGTSVSVDSNSLNADQPQIRGGIQEKGVKVANELAWPESAVSAVTALERALDEAFSTDFAKYNQKLRSLAFNLKNTALLAQRLLKGELEPSSVLNMSHNELKVGLTAEEISRKKTTAEEIARNQPEESSHMQMTDARCKRCTEKKVALVDIMQAGHGARYQLECIACGNMWYASEMR